MVAGQAVDIGSSSVRRTLCALRRPGTETISLGTLIKVGIVRVRARSGTSSNLCKPAFRQLLLPACRIQRDHLHRVRIIEVCFGGIVKGQVPVFADPQQAELRVGLSQLLHIILSHPIGIGRTPIDLKEFRHGHTLGQILAQIAAEGSGMILIDPNILIQMETMNFPPRQIGHRGQRA